MTAHSASPTERSQSASPGATVPSALAIEVARRRVPSCTKLTDTPSRTSPGCTA